MHRFLLDKLTVTHMVLTPPGPCWGRKTPDNAALLSCPFFPSLFPFSFQKLQDHLARFSHQYDQLVAFKPTGWTFSQQIESVEDIQPQKSGNITIYGTHKAFFLLVFGEEKEVSHIRVLSHNNLSVVNIVVFSLQLPLLVKPETSLIESQ